MKYLFIAALTGLTLVALYFIFDKLLEKVIDVIQDLKWLDKISYYLFV